VHILCWQSLKCLCHDLCNLLFVIIGIFCNISLKENIPSSQDYQASKLPDMTSNRELKIRFLLFLAYKIPDLMSYPVTLRADNPMKMVYFLIKIYCIS
jgi:hypothetical protein